MEGGKEAHGERDQNELQKSEAVLQYETGVPEERDREEYCNSAPVVWC